MALLIAAVTLMASAFVMATAANSRGQLSQKPGH